MIRYNYTLERDESDEKKIYTPVLPLEIPDLAYIQGPNSSGKSTFLNLIALAFFGHKLGPEELNESLHERLVNLSQADHQKLQFDIELTTKNGDVKLHAIKRLDSREPEVRKIGVDGKSRPISFDQFKREFRLIYDIPQDPLSRLPLLLREIKIAQIDRGYQISRLKKRLLDIITEVKESKNPSRLAELRLNIDSSKKKLERVFASISEKEDNYSRRRNFSALKSYIDALNEHGDVSAKIKRLESQINRYKKTENKQ
jgi:DNA repair protein SbcC/Rad50